LTTAAQTAITSVGTLTALTVDNISINTSTVTASGDLIFDAAADIVLDADGGKLKLKDDGTEFGQIYNNSGLHIIAKVSNQDIVFLGNDGGSETTLLTLDTSNAGDASFNGSIRVGGDTAAGSAASIGYTAAEGLILTGQGSTNDVTIKNDADATVLEIATGQPSIEITAGDLFFGTAGKGIVLGSTTNIDDNTLSDFEKGTFNAFVQDASGNSEQYYEQNGQYNRGQYTKTGNIVHFTINFYTSGSSGVTGSEGARVIGLPFASSGSGSVGTNGFVTAPYMSGMASGVASILTGRIIDGQTYILLDKIDGNGNTSNMTVTEWSQARCTLAGFYRTG